MVGTVEAQTDTSNLFAVTTGVTGDEDDGREVGTTGIPLTIRYALDDSDGSETVKIQLKVLMMISIHQPVTQTLISLSSLI